MYIYQVIVFYGSKMNTIDIATSYFDGVSIFNSCTNLKTIKLYNLTTSS